MIGSIMGPIIGLTTPGGGGVPPVVETAFVSTWDTTQAGSASGTIVLPMTAGPLVDWGDGTIDNLNTHTYAGTPTDVEIKIYGPVTGWKFNNTGDKDKLSTIENWGGFQFSGERTFFGCGNLGPILATDAPQITHALGLQIAFLLCSSMTSITGIETWDTSICESFDSFMGSTGVTGAIDLSSFNTSNVNIMTNTFLASPGIISIGAQSWDISNVTNMARFLEALTLSTSEYDALLINYEAQAVQDNVAFHGGSSQYSAGAAADARQRLIDDHSWTITDGGQV